MFTQSFVLAATAFLAVSVSALPAPTLNHLVERQKSAPAGWENWGYEVSTPFPRICI